ncbi:MAG: hypothetical protein ABR925_06610 [Acidimicrobiales bacterium]
MPRRSPERGSRRGDATGRSRSPKSRNDNGGNAITAWAGTNAGTFVDDAMAGGVAQVRHVQPHQADKTYICPGCNQEIRPGTGHVVVVPVSDSDSRRHWHTPCWEYRDRRRPTGR